MRRFEPTDAESDPLFVNRRGLFLGAGVAALAATSLTGVQAARATPDAGAHSDGTARPDGAARPDSSPITDTIASAPISGYTYRSVCMYDFEPFNPAAAKTWGGSGIYSAGVASTMRATLEIPPGALLRDVEFYVYNNSGNAITAEAWLYTPGHGLITSLTSVSVPSSTQVSTVRTSLPSTVWGPYPSGSRLLVGMTTPTDGSVQINGARIGMTQGSGAIGLLPVAKRVYDSHATTKFAAGEVRTITLPSTSVAAGTTAVLINVTAAEASVAGGLNVWPASAAEPPTTTVSYLAGHSASNAVIVGISSIRQFKIRSSQAAHVLVDLGGTVA